ncbi:MAG: MogA/MoaB family molybdenum cofactor biosynthesis protein [Actinomycetota bacterium]|nr:MogA/MoaB family molybdenum cofactor biosynthesis protein [Actinomycetota bacterium]
MSQESHPRAKVLTVSDGVIAGTRQDASGVALASLLAENGFEVVERRACSDGTAPVSEMLQKMAAGFSGLIVTTGGTGFTERDLTPEATLSVIQREAPGFAEAMRAVNPLGMLSRGVAGVRDGALILNTPGSPKGSVEMLGAVMKYIPHALALMGDPHAEHPGPSAG